MPVLILEIVRTINPYLGKNSGCLRGSQNALSALCSRRAGARRQATWDKRCDEVAAHAENSAEAARALGKNLLKLRTPSLDAVS